ncbi:MAG: DUF1569 domain-containing protein [Pseudomonadota bacterium]
MKTTAHPTRRSFVTTTAGASAAFIITGCQGSSPTDRQLQFSSFADAEKEIARLAQARELSSAATFSWAQTLVHCAQSIEFSMNGFPQPKSQLFQRTAGSAAFAVFSWRGRMAHDLAEPIPGAPVLDAKLEPALALERLRAAITGFQRWSAPLQPHFAYGALDKKEYELAHAMHLANHLSGFQVKG